MTETMTGTPKTDGERHIRDMFATAEDMSLQSTRYRTVTPLDHAMREAGIIRIPTERTEVRSGTAVSRVAVQLCRIGQ